jgi:hypothetical protein
MHGARKCISSGAGARSASMLAPARRAKQTLLRPPFRAEQDSEISGARYRDTRRAGQSLLGAEPGATAFPRLTCERIARLSYRRILGNPKCGKTLLSPNQVIADIRSLSSVRTSIAYGRAMSVWGVGK